MKSRRKKYLVNNPYQVGHVVIMLFLVFIVIFIAVVLTHYHTVASILDSVNKTGEIPTGTELLNISIRPMIIVIPIIVILLVFVALYIIYITHRTAGPLLKLKQAMNRVGDGDFSKELKFRKYDDIHDMAESFNTMMDKLRKRFSIQTKKNHKEN